MKTLIIDDSNFARTTIKGFAEAVGWKVIGECATGEEGIDSIFKLRPDLVTLDNVLPDMTGLDILRAISSLEVKPKVIMISAVGQQSVIEEASYLGVIYYLVKPINLDQFKSAASRLG